MWGTLGSEGWAFQLLSAWCAVPCAGRQVALWLHSVRGVGGLLLAPFCRYHSLWDPDPVLPGSGERPKTEGPRGEGARVNSVGCSGVVTGMHPVVGGTHLC